MSFRTLLSVAATGSAIAIGVVVPALPGAAAPSGGCPYPPNKPVLTLTASPATVVATHKVTAFGKFTQNNCGIKGASIVLQHRALVSGKPSGSWHTLTTVTTTSQGTYSASSAPRKNEQERVVFNKAGSFPTTVSPTRSILVRPHLSLSDTTLSTCRVHVSGTVVPVKANRKIKIQKRGASGHFKGWTTVWSTTTNRKGAYSSTHTLACGTTYNLSTLVAADSVNGYGRSRTIFGIKTHR